MRGKVVFGMMLIALCAAAFAQTPAGWAFTGENEPLLEGTIWVDTEYAPSLIITYEFRFGGKFVCRYKDASGGSIDSIDNFTGTWQREGNNLKLLFDNNRWKKEGRYYPNTQRIMFSDDTTLELQQGSSIASPAPAQSAQPAPAQSGSSSSASSSSSSSSSSSRPAAPTLQNGRYAWANSGSNMTMTLTTTGFINAYVGNSVISIWQGTYRISGNQLVITVSNPTSEYSFMRGQTYTYTITGDTSFQGNGETWVRTGSF
jgi:hypothetical protein